MDLASPRHAFAEATAAVPGRTPAGLKISRLSLPCLELRGNHRVRVTGVHVARDISEIFFHASRDQTLGDTSLRVPAHYRKISAIAVHRVWEKGGSGLMKLPTRIATGN